MDYSKWVTGWHDALSGALQKAGSHLPNVAGAIALLIGGWLLQHSAPLDRAPRGLEPHTSAANC